MFRTLAASLTIGLLILTPARADDRPSTLTLVGSGAVSVAPDIATLSIGVEIQEDTASDALRENSDQTAKVIATLKDAGVEPRDIQTSNFSVQPVYDNKRASSGRPSVAGYRVTNMVTARVRDLDGLGALLDKVVTDGANRVNGLSFGIEDDREAMDAARALAVKEAARKAALYAEAAGVTLGPILSISEGGSGPDYYPEMEMRSAAMAVPVERGETTISASINMTWQISE